MPKRKRVTTKPRRPTRAAQARPNQPAVPVPGITIVGVGASAGGLEAFSQLLEALPGDADLAVVFVQHLAPHHESALPALLASHSAMPVVQVTDGVAIRRNHVYVIPPNVAMIVKGHTLALRPRDEGRTRHTPIDTFFTSLALASNGRPVAVVLSGTASDGALGLREVKAAGGITLAQEPGSAKYDGMPRAAIATGAVDLILTPAQIGAELGRIARHPYARWSPPEPQDDVTVPDEQLQRIFELLRPVSGVDFRHYKLPTIRRRLWRRMVLHRLTDVESYLRLLQSDPHELRGLFQDLLIHVTRFFREPESFEALTATVLPKLLEDRPPDRPIRVWVCGCATGEEAYSLAMCLVEYLQNEQLDVPVQIFATDLSESAIEHARAGVYAASIASDVPPERLRRFFTRTDGSYRVSKVIRDMCVFARQDLTKDPPFSRLDLVMCRNVLIYMDAVLQRRLLTMFHYALNPQGYLVLGRAESAGAQVTLYSLVDKKHRIHRKKHTPGATPAMAMPLSRDTAAPRKRPVAETAVPDKSLQVEVSRVMLDRYAPAGVVVDADLQIVQFRGQTGAYLEPAPGDASLNLLKMAREGLLYGLRAAIHAARKTKAPARKDDLKVRAGRAWTTVAVEVVPLQASGRLHYLVIFDEARRERASKATREAAPKSGGTRAGRDDLTMLRRELEASREYLQSIIQELEAANEELQSANEEVLSSNEELQSTNEELDTAKEELQSANEELNTLNEELHGRNQEMGRVNSDLVNLIGSVQIAIVIVGPDLRIRRFTPMAEKVLNLIPTDLERSISHINPNIDCPDLEQLILGCMDSVALVERDVQDRQGRWYSLRIRPYKNLDNKIDGAVLALFDIDILKRSEQQATRARLFADNVINGMAQPLAILQPDLKIRQVNASFAELFGLAPEDIRGRHLTELAGSGWRMTSWPPVATATPGTPLPAVDVPADRAGRWNTPLSVSGRVVPSPELAESSLVLLTVAPKG